jgi:hypothetical protein
LDPSSGHARDPPTRGFILGVGVPYGVPSGIWRSYALCTAPHEGSMVHRASLVARSPHGTGHETASAVRAYPLRPALRCRFVGGGRGIDNFWIRVRATQGTPQPADLSWGRGPLRGPKWHMAPLCIVHRASRRKHCAPRLAGAQKHAWHKARDSIRRSRMSFAACSGM